VPEASQTNARRTALIKLYPLNAQWKKKVNLLPAAQVDHLFEQAKGKNKIK
jgi:hypothetical protein